MLRNTTLWLLSVNLGRTAMHHFPIKLEDLIILRTKEDEMIIHQREIGYGTDYPEFFAALSKATAYLERKYPEISIELMYNLAGERRRVTIQTRYASLADYERIDAEVDNDKEYSKLLASVITDKVFPIVDQFYRVI